MMFCSNDVAEKNSYKCKGNIDHTTVVAILCDYFVSILTRLRREGFEEMSCSFEINVTINFVNTHGSSRVACSSLLNFKNGVLHSTNFPNVHFQRKYVNYFV